MMSRVKKTLVQRMGPPLLGLKDLTRSIEEAYQANVPLFVDHNWTKSTPKTRLQDTVHKFRNASSNAAVRAKLIAAIHGPDWKSILQQEIKEIGVIRHDEAPKETVRSKVPLNVVVYSTAKSGAYEAESSVGIACQLPVSQLARQSPANCLQDESLAITCPGNSLPIACEKKSQDLDQVPQLATRELLGQLEEKPVLKRDFETRLQDAVHKFRNASSNTAVRAKLDAAIHGPDWESIQQQEIKEIGVIRPDEAPKETVQSEVPLNVVVYSPTKSGAYEADLSVSITCQLPVSEITCNRLPRQSPANCHQDKSPPTTCQLPASEITCNRLARQSPANCHRYKSPPIPCQLSASQIACHRMPNVCKTNRLQSPPPAITCQWPWRQIASHRLPIACKSNRLPSPAYGLRVESPLIDCQLPARKTTFHALPRQSPANCMQDKSPAIACQRPSRQIVCHKLPIATKTNRLPSHANCLRVNLPAISSQLPARKTTFHALPRQSPANCLQVESRAIACQLPANKIACHALPRQYPANCLQVKSRSIACQLPANKIAFHALPRQYPANCLQVKSRAIACHLPANKIACHALPRHSPANRLPSTANCLPLIANCLREELPTIACESKYMQKMTRDPDQVPQLATRELLGQLEEMPVLKKDFALNVAVDNNGFMSHWLQEWRQGQHV